MITFANLVIALRAELWPSGEAKTLRTAHTGYFKAAMADIQQWVEQLQQHNISIYARCDRLWYDAMSVIAVPNGKVARVFSIVNDEWRDKVWYHSSNYHALTRIAKRLYEAVTPSTGLSFGYEYSEEDVDSTNGRSRAGEYAIERGKLYVAPWLQSNEKLVIEWEGVKTAYADADEIDDAIWDKSVQEAIKYYVQWQHELYFGDPNRAGLFERLYSEKRADLMTIFNDRTRQQEAKPVPEAVDHLTQDAIDDDDDAADDAGEACETPLTTVPGEIEVEPPAVEDEEE